MSKPVPLVSAVHVESVRWQRAALRGKVVLARCWKVVQGSALSLTSRSEECGQPKAKGVTGVRCPFRGRRDGKPRSASEGEARHAVLAGARSEPASR